MKNRKIQVHLFGATGERTTEVFTRGGFLSRHIHAPRETAPVSEKISVCPEPTTPSEAPKVAVAVPEDFQVDSPILRSMQQMHKTMSGWLILEEILYVATTQFGVTANQRTLLDAMRTLYREGQVEHQRNRFGQDCFRLATQKPALKALLAEVDAIMVKTDSAIVNINR